MRKKSIFVLALAFSLVAVGFVLPRGLVLAETSNIPLEAFQKQIEYLTGLIKNLQAQLDALRSGQTQPVPAPTPVPLPTPDQGWDSLLGILSIAGPSTSQWGTHTIQAKYIPDPDTTNTIGLESRGYPVKAVNDDVLAQLKKYEGQNVTLWGQLQYQNIEGGFMGFIAKKVYPKGYGCILPAKAKIGSTGDDVKIVQKYLATDKSVYPEGLVTGYYGQLTKKAVERFQEKNGLTATGELDDSTRVKIEGVVAPTLIGSGEQIFPCPTPEPPIPDPKLIPSQGIKVYSPQAGENWQLGQTYRIAWSQGWPTVGCTNPTPGQPGVPVCVSPNFVPIGPVTITLRNYAACLYEEPVRCVIAEATPYVYVITDKIDNKEYFTWTIPTDLAKEYRDGKVIITVSSLSGGFSGRSGAFTIRSGVAIENKPPVVSGISGPTSLTVGENGTWAVKAYDPENGSLSYSVLWGDESVMALGGATAPKTMSVQNTATFTHSYSVAGNYTPVFYVTDSSGQQAKTSMSVVVGNTTQTNSWPKIIGKPAIPSVIYAGHQTNFSWSATDTDGDRLFWNVNWGGNEVVYPAVTCYTSVGSNPNCWNFNAGHTWSSAGNYLVTVTVSDGRGGSATNSFSVVVLSGPNVNQLPVIDYLVGSSPLVVGQTGVWNFRAIDPEGQNLYYGFEYGDGTSSNSSPNNSGATLFGAHAYSIPGTYTIKFGVRETEFSDFRATKTMNVNVVAAQNNNQPPVVATPLSGPRAVTVGFVDVWNVTANDPNGDVLTYHFYWGDGTANYISGASGNSVVVNHAYQKEGVYTLYATVGDSLGGGTLVSMPVTVVSVSNSR